jgi:hypothetical protein
MSRESYAPIAIAAGSLLCKTSSGTSRYVTPWAPSGVTLRDSKGFGNAFSSLEDAHGCDHVAGAVYQGFGWLRFHPIAPQVLHQLSPAHPPIHNIKGVNAALTRHVVLHGLRRIRNTASPISLRICHATIETKPLPGVHHVRDIGSIVELHLRRRHS